MTTLSQSSSNETALQKEQLLFREIFDRLLDTLLNNIFDLRPEKAQTRRRNLMFLFLVSGLLITLLRYPLILWTQRLQEIFLYLLNPAYATSYTNGDPFIKFFTLAYRAATDARILQYLLIFLVTFLIARQLAAIYVGDFFELENISMSRKLVSAVALLGGDETIRIMQGNIAEQHRESLSYLIGGPGKVIVDVDSVAVFERADGTPHVIGPTGTEPDGKATIDGFQRFRSAIYVRDQYGELDNVMGRSRDGILISARDVHLVYSVHRGENVEPTLEVPFLFSKEAVESIVYKSSSRVTPDLPYPSVHEFSWQNNILGLVHSGLSTFISEHNLTEFLARPDISARSPSSHTESTSRQKITSLFSQYAEEFTKQAHIRGVELYWIGVGTWKFADIISKKQLEAWILSQKNLRDGNDEAMKNVESEALLQKMETMIREVPIGAYYDILGMKRQHVTKTLDRKQEIQFKDDENNDILLFDEEEILETFDGNAPRIDDLKKLLNEKIEASVAKRIRNFTGEPNHQDRINKLLVEYRKQLLEALQFMKTKNEPVNPVIEEAIGYINSQINSDAESDVNI